MKQSLPWFIGALSSILAVSCGYVFGAYHVRQNINERIILAEVSQRIHGSAYQRTYALCGVNAMLRVIDYDMDCMTHMLYEYQKTFSADGRKTAFKVLREVVSSHKYYSRQAPVADEEKNARVKADAVLEIIRKSIPQPVTEEEIEKQSIIDAAVDEINQEAKERLRIDRKPLEQETGEPGNESH